MDVVICLDHTKLTDYADWALTNLPVFPEEVLSSTVRVPMPTSLVKEHGLSEAPGLVDLDNPLFSFRLPDGTADKFKASFSVLILIPSTRGASSFRHLFRC